MKNIKFSVVMVLTLLLSVSLFAQRGRGNNKHYNRGYNQSRPNYQYAPRQNYRSVRVMPRYNYRPNYRPAYRPYYRPAYRPVYRPVYRPIYRSPRAYVHFGPTFGVRLNVLPYGYSRIYVDRNPYYYNEGVYYRPQANNQYEVVAPPLGAVVNKIPSNATVTVVDGMKYYQVGGTFYRDEISENGQHNYRVVGTDGVLNTIEESTTEETMTEEITTEDTMTEEVTVTEDQNLNAYDEVIPAMGTRVDKLPLNSKVQVINQQKYFLSPAGIYYIEVVEDDKIKYEVTTVQ
jgi:hypothetical protein